MFGQGEDVAVFGAFTYRSNTLGKVVTSPFSIHVNVVDGKVTYLQFLDSVGSLFAHVGDGSTSQLSSMTRQLSSTLSSNGSE
jgi:hypothetical protein